VWKWRQGSREERGGDHGPARKAVVLESSILVLAGFLLLWFTEKAAIGWIVVFMGALTGCAGLFAPPVYHALKRAGQKLGRIAGVCLTWLLLVPFFYICFSLGRLILAVRRKDPLHRRFPTDKKTYWEDRPAVRDASHYERQY